MNGAATTTTAGELLGYAHPGEAPESTAVEKLTLKRGELFAVTNRVGDIVPAGARDLGFFREDTRFLSFLRLSVKGGPPICLSTQTSSDFINQIDLTVTGRGFGGVLLGEPVNYLHVRRQQLIDEQLSDSFVLTNFAGRPVDFWVELEFGADFADVFEIRGWHRARRGTYFAPEVGTDRVILRYLGLDQRRYRTELRFLGPPATLDGRSARFELHLDANESTTLELRVLACLDDEQPTALRPWSAQAASARAEYASWGQCCASVETDDEQFTLALAQGVADLKALSTTRGGEPVIAAGIPWYTCPFGRDTLLTAYEALLVAPSLARDALVFLAAHQGTRVDESRDEEPGKILHELRSGEMALTREIPHTPYYGSVDSTPLFLVLLDEYHLWTGDTATVRALLPAAERALEWIERYGDRDGDGLIEYHRKTAQGLSNQGWKDSFDGVIFANGTVARGPIALVEVQGYAADAFRRMGSLFRRLGQGARGTALLARARRLSTLIDERFWMPEQGFYAEALDGDKRQVDSVTSNPGHLLFSRAIPRRRAELVGRRLVSDSMFSGWGVRTLAKGQGAYNPLSYHNGTVWPHDNALCAQGLASYGQRSRVVTILDGLYAASLHFQHHRLPELFCGLGRASGDFPVQYPVACSPQAWASAAFFLLLRALLGIEPDAPRGTLHLIDPQLPSWLHEVHIRRFRVGDSSVDLHFTRYEGGVYASATHRDGPPLRVRISVG